MKNKLDLSERKFWINGNIQLLALKRLAVIIYPIDNFY